MKWFLKYKSELNRFWRSTTILRKQKWDNEESNTETDETISKVVDKKTRFIPAKMEKICNIAINWEYCNGIVELFDKEDNIIGKISIGG